MTPEVQFILLRSRLDPELLNEDFGFFPNSIFSSSMHLDFPAGASQKKSDRRLQWLSRALRFLAGLVEFYKSKNTVSLRYKTNDVIHNKISMLNCADEVSTVNFTFFFILFFFTIFRQRSGYM